MGLHVPLVQGTEGGFGKPARNQQCRGERRDEFNQVHVRPPQATGPTAGVTTLPSRRVVEKPIARMRINYSLGGQIA
jgi:hypothetical protein